MIRINLIPIEDLDNPLWWVGDSIIAILMLAISFVGVQYYMNGIHVEIEQLKDETVQVDNQTATYAAQVAKYDQIEQNMQEIQTKLDSLQSITVSKLAKYRPLILIELLHGLKPDGVWFKSITLDKGALLDRAQGGGGDGDGTIAENANKGKGIVIKGYALENLAIAEFMSELQASRENKVDPRDLRTQVYFTDLRLEDIKLENNSEIKTNKKGEKEAVKITSFALYLNYIEREYRNQEQASLK